LQVTFDVERLDETFELMLGLIVYWNMQIEPVISDYWDKNCLYI